MIILFIKYTIGVGWGPTSFKGHRTPSLENFLPQCLLSPMAKPGMTFFTWGEGYEAPEDLEFGAPFPVVLHTSINWTPHFKSMLRH